MGWTLNWSLKNVNYTGLDALLAPIWSVPPKYCENKSIITLPNIAKHIIKTWVLILAFPLRQSPHVKSEVMLPTSSTSTRKKGFDFPGQSTPKKKYIRETLALYRSSQEGNHKVPPQKSPITSFRVIKGALASLQGQKQTSLIKQTKVFIRERFKVPSTPAGSATASTGPTPKRKEKIANVFQKSNEKLMSLAF